MIVLRCTFFGVELEGKATGIPLRVRRALLSADSGKACKHRSPFPDFLKEFCLAILAQIWSGHLKVAVGTGALGMNHTLRNPLSIEMRQLINQIEILD